MDEIILNQCIGFEWDEGNYNKNWAKHNVEPSECEQIFFNEPLLLFKDDKHSDIEDRMYVLGQTDSNRKLFLVFTIRNHHIRVISARSMNRKEREIYEKA